MRLSVPVLTFVLCGVAAGTFNAQQPPTPSDFSVRYEVTDCQAERFDSATGEYVRPMPKEFGPQPLTARIGLDDVKMNTIFRMVSDIGFMDYPSAFKGTATDRIVTVSPSSTYRLEVRSGGVTHAVSFTDQHRPMTPEWYRLHAVVQLIIGFVHDHPALRALRPQFPCE
jgi:hypothetical protein